MITRDALGWVCREHGRVALGGGDQAERQAADHLRLEHVEMWRRLVKVGVQDMIKARAN